jgi:hypothetical protein
VISEIADPVAHTAGSRNRMRRPRVQPVMTHTTDRQQAVTRSRAATPRRRALTGAAVAATGLVAACGSVAAPGSGAAPSSSAPAAPKGSLNVTVYNGPSQPVSHWTLRCDPPGGTHPNAASACGALLNMKDPFAPVTKAGTACPMILASSRRVTFTGTWFGQRVNLTIVDGECSLARWSQLGQVVN